ncbi:putative sel1-like repeat protein [Burkholderia thailandensis MSMB121]|nr:putative sel1-like repeat protein [Burkholderia thailandensis MSMB121]ATF34759.1 hypothetical protein CO709_15890 [Burkholderia thailandensis]KST75336.1 hypothetical protein WS76_14985 [Burkholderia humptydooensis]
MSYESKKDDAEQEDLRIAALKERAKTEPKAVYDLGLRYFRGDGVRQDSYQALGVFYLFGLEEMGAHARGRRGLQVTHAVA